MAKNKQRAAEKAKQKRALKNRRRQKANKGKVRPKKSDEQSFKIPEGEFPEQDRVFWMAHGINFLHSDWDEAIWNPLFPEVYSNPEKVDIDLISSRLVALSEKDSDNMTGPERAILGYAFQGELAHFAFMKEAERRLTEKGVEDPAETARQPHQSTVWEMFHDEVLVKAVKRAEGT